MHVGRHSAGSDGKFGHDLFAGQVVEVDLTARCWWCNRMPDDVTGYQALTIERQGSSLLLKCVLTVAEERMEQPVMLHTGYHGARSWAPRPWKRMARQVVWTRSGWRCSPMTGQ